MKQTCKERVLERWPGAFVRLEDEAVRIAYNTGRPSPRSGQGQGIEYLGSGSTEEEAWEDAATNIGLVAVSLHRNKEAWED